MNLRCSPRSWNAREDTRIIIGYEITILQGVLRAITNNAQNYDARVKGDLMEWNIHRREGQLGERKRSVRCKRSNKHKQEKPKQKGKSMKNYCKWRNNAVYSLNVETACT